MRSFVWAFLLLVLAILVSACGGGTRGSGIPDERYSIIGTLTFDSGVQPEGLSVTVVETGDSTDVRPDGTFELETTRTNVIPTLLFSGQDYEQRVQLEGVNETGDTVVALRLP